MIVLPVILYIADIGMPPPIHPQRRVILNANFFRNRYRSSLHAVARRAGYRLQQDARANHKLVLRLHSRLECCLHRYASYIAFCRNGFDIPPSACFPLVRAHRVPHLAHPEANARRQDGLQPYEGLRYCHRVWYVSYLSIFSTTHGNLTRE